MTIRMTYPRLLTEAAGILENAGIISPVSEAREIMFRVFGLDLKRYADIMAGIDGTLPDAGSCDRYFECVRKRSEGVPLQYITGSAPFMGRDFSVNENVLIPRFDTEILVDTALSEIKKDISAKRPSSYDIIDIGTGSGCIIVSIALELGECIKDISPETNVNYTGCDISEKALECAKKNAGDLCAPVTFIQSDIFDSVKGTFDAIVSNPPYIRSGDIGGLDGEVRLYEPHTALDGGAEGTDFYRRISSNARDRLKDGGVLAYETGFDEAEDVSAILEENGYIEIKVIKDLAGLDRVVTCRKPCA